MVAGKAVRRVLIWGGAILAITLAVLAAALIAASPGTPPALVDGAGRPVAGGISEKLRVRLNGVDQGMFIVGKDRTKPVLLFVHGGPGMPEYAIGRGHPPVLEELFTVCWWEQRGAGLSNGADLDPGSVTIAQLVEDTLAVTEYLRTRFGQDRIYLFAHSWGTVIALQAAARAPRLYRAYIAMSQVTRQLESEKRAYAYMLERYRAAGDARMVRALERTPLPALDEMPAAYRPLRDEAMHRLGVGTTRAMRSVVRGIFLPVMACPQYTLGEKIALWRGKWSDRSSAMWNEMLHLDLPARIPALDLPVYFLHGAHDQTVSYDLARAYAAALEAPSKGFYTFPDAAHSPLFDEPERARRILRDDVLAGAHALADR